MLSSLTANMHRDSKKRPEPFTPKDFMVPWYEEPKEKVNEKSDWGAAAFISFERIIKQQEADKKMRGQVVSKPE
jgi:hypothetical protein